MAATTVEAPGSADAEWAAKMDRLRTRKPMERSVTLYDEDAADAVTAATEAVVEVRARVAAELADEEPDAPLDDLRARVDAHPDVVAAEAASAAAVEAEADAQVRFTFRNLPGDVWEELVGEHPPTAEQADRGEAYNVSTFAPALIAACSTQPLTVEVVMTWWPQLSQGEQSLLFGTAAAVNQAARASVGKGSGPTRS